ncbi:hypothetical protein [Methylogaea oryzae]|uniref:hypothetical protein n=1 Tax=Methylogaea oryzae TaxID=1295382 RepID=UPI001C3F31E6|nr:hypothetical protein [Methylogaea oryzae]
MTLTLKQLELNKDYTFHVTVVHGEKNYAGELALKPDKIILTVKWEEFTDNPGAFWMEKNRSFIM